MNTCQYCGHKNPNEYHICMNCAAALTSTCPICHHPVPQGDKFCGQCGVQIEIPQRQGTTIRSQFVELGQSISNMLTNLREMTPIALAQVPPQEAPKVVGQRREVTVLFVDITNFTHAVEQLGNEDVFIVKNALMERMFKVIRRYEGTIEKSNDEGLMALFGIPWNHENDPERAVRAALEIQENVHRQMGLSNYKHDLGLGIRIGINTGVVVVGRTESKYPLEYIVIGNTVDLGSKLIKHARPGTILTSFQTFKRVRPFFFFEILPSIVEIGYEQPIQIYKPTELRILPDQVRRETRRLSPYIGRQLMLTKLDELLSRVDQQQTPQIVCVSGEAGLGKTRLITEFRKSKAGSGTKFYLGSCNSFMRVTPYQIFQKILREILHISATDSTRDQTEAVSNHLKYLGLDENKIAPYLLHVLGLPQGNPYSLTRLNLLEPTVLQRQTHAALKDILVAEANLASTVLILDDLHWIDQASIEFLAYFCQAVDNVPILVILISRDFDSYPVFYPQTQQFLASLNRLTEITLQPLTTLEIKNLVEGSIEDADPSIEWVIQTISNRSEGNPFYTEEIVHMVMEGGGLIRDNGQWRTDPHLDDMIQEIPVTLKDIILARFDKLPDRTQTILQKAALLGTAFALFLLRTQVDESDEELSEHLSRLEKRGFIDSTLEEVDRVYTFKQAIVRDTIYSTILKRNREHYHYQAAQTIKTFEFWLPGEKSEILAHHLQNSNKPLEAIPHLIAAGEKAAARCANKIAAKHYQDALNLLEGSKEIDPMSYARARTGLGTSLKYAGEYEEATEVLQDAIDQMLAYLQITPEKMDDILSLLADGYREFADIRAREGKLEEGLALLKSGIDLLGEFAETEHPINWRKLIDRIIWIQFRQGKLDLANTAAKKALSGSENWGADDPLILASLNNTMGGIAWMQSQYKKAISYVQKSLEIYNMINYHWGKAISSTNLGILHFSRGNWSEAVRLFEQADAIHVEQGYLPDRPTNLKNLGEVLMNLGDYESARKYLMLSQKISNQLGMSINEAYAEIGLCRLSIYESDVTEAEKHLQSATVFIDDSVDQVDDRHISVMLLEALILPERGEINRAIQLCRKALAMASEGGLTGEKSEAKRIYGRLCALAGRYDLAEELLLDGIKLAKEQENPYHQAQAQYELGNLYAIQSQKAEETQNEPELERWSKKALSELNLSIEKFETLGAQHDLEKAEKLVAKLTTLFPIK